MTVSPNPLPLNPITLNWVFMFANVAGIPDGPIVIASTPFTVKEQSEASTEASRNPVFDASSFHVFPPSVEYCGLSFAVADNEPWIQRTLKYAALTPDGITIEVS